MHLTTPITKKMRQAMKKVERGLNLRNSQKWASGLKQSTPMTSMEVFGFRNCLNIGRSFHTQVSLNTISVGVNRSNQQRAQVELNIESVHQWTQQELQNLLILLYKWRSTKQNTTELKNLIDSILSETKKFIGNNPGSEDVLPKLFALQISAQHIKEHELSAADEQPSDKKVELSRLSFSTSKLQAVVKKKTDLASLTNAANESQETMKVEREKVVGYLNDMNGIFNLLQCWSLSKIVLQKLLYFQYDLTSVTTRNIIEDFLKSGKTDSLVMYIFGSYFQLSTIYERENQIRNAISTLVSLLPKLEDAKSVLTEMSTTREDLSKHISNLHHYIKDINKRLSILFEKMHDYASSADHLAATLPKDESGAFDLTSENISIRELKSSLLKLGYLRTMSKQWKQADNCYEDLTLITARQLSSISNPEFADLAKQTSHNIVLDSVVVSYEWTVFLRKMLLTLLAEREKETSEEDMTEQPNLDITSRIKTITRLLDIGGRIGENLSLFDDSVPTENEELSSSASMIHYIKDKVEVQAFTELAKLQLVFMKNFLATEIMGDWNQFSEVWDHLLLSMNHVLTLETNLTQDFTQLWGQVAKHFQTFKEAIINEGLHLLVYMVMQLNDKQNRSLIEEDMFESYFENLLVILSRNEVCFENTFKIWVQFRALYGSYALFRQKSSSASAELDKEITHSVLEKDRVLECLKQVGSGVEEGFNLPFLLYDILVEVFSKPSEMAERTSVYKRAYRVLAPSKDIALKKALQFETWVVEGKMSETEIYEAEIDRTAENTEKQTLLFLNELIKEEGEHSGDYLYAGIVNTSSKAMAP